MELAFAARLTASIIRKKTLESFRCRGALGSAVYLVRNCWRLARLLRFRVREAAYDHDMSVETDRLIAPGYLGLEAHKIAGVAVNPRGIAYVATPAWMLTNILKKLRITYADYSFIDLGSGMGRAVLMGAEFPFRSVVGVEFSRELHCIAESNLRRCPPKRKRASSIRLLCLDATDYAIPEGKCIIYMFNPFREPVMKKVIANMEQRQKTNPSDLYVIYLNPVLAQLLDTAPFLDRVATSKYYNVYRAAADLL